MLIITDLVVLIHSDFSKSNRAVFSPIIDWIRLRLVIFQIVLYNELNIYHL